MTSIRLPSDLENKLNNISEIENVTKSEIIKFALQKYVDEFFSDVDAYEAGKDLFGKYGSGCKENSAKYKAKIKDIISAKFTD